MTATWADVERAGGEAHAFLEELAETPKDYLAELTRVPLLIINDLGMRKLPPHLRAPSPQPPVRA